MNDGAIAVGGDHSDGDGRHEDGDGLDSDDALAEPLHVRPEGPLLVEGLPQRYRKRTVDGGGSDTERETDVAEYSLSTLHRCMMHQKKGYE